MEFQYPALKARLRQVIEEMERLRGDEREFAMKEILRLLRSVDLRPEDLRRLLRRDGRPAMHFAVRDSKKRSTPLKVQRSLFIHPETGQSWNGLGRRPKWLTGSLERCRIVGF